MLSVLDISSECEIGPFSGSIRNVVVGGEEMEEVRRQKGPPPKRRERGNKIGRERET